MFNLDYKEKEVSSPLGLHLKEVLCKDKKVEIKELEYKDTFVKILIKHYFSVKVEDSEILIFVGIDNDIKYGFKLEMPCTCDIVNGLNKLISNLEKIIQDFIKNQEVEDKEGQQTKDFEKVLEKFIDTLAEIIKGE